MSCFTRFITPNFTARRFLVRLVGHDYDFVNISETNTAEDVIEVPMQDLNEEQKKLVPNNLDAF